MGATTTERWEIVATHMYNQRKLDMARLYGSELDSTPFDALPRHVQESWRGPAEALLLDLDAHEHGPP